MSDFAVIRADVWEVAVCTSLDEIAATDRLNALWPTAIRTGWTMSETALPVWCRDRPDTHRHLFFER